MRGDPDPDPAVLFITKGVDLFEEAGVRCLRDASPGNDLSGRIIENGLVILFQTAAGRPEAGAGAAAWTAVEKT